VGRLACQNNSYQTEIDTVVLECRPSIDGFEVILEDTVVFPTGGGQPFDTGRIEYDNKSVFVTKAERQGLECVHFVLEAIPVQTRVTVKVDWDRRFDHMQHHSGQHVISDGAELLFGWETFGWSLGSERCFVEFKTTIPTQEQLDKLESWVNQKIRENHQVTVTVSDPEVMPDSLPEDLKSENKGPVRMVAYESIVPNPCCGTHVSSLGHIQAVKFLSTEKIRGGNFRLWFVCGNRVFREFQRSLDRDKILNGLLSQGPNQFADAISALQRKLKEANKLVKTLQKENRQL
ncbi:Threonyl/alanyl tRNA synthetase, partial [Gorgonomyces haynaldii]